MTLSMGVWVSPPRAPPPPPGQLYRKLSAICDMTKITLNHNNIIIHQARCMRPIFSLYPAKLNNLNFHPLEVVDRGSETQLQMGENYTYLFNLTPNIANLDV